MSDRNTSHTAQISPRTGWLRQRGLGGAAIAALAAFAVVLPLQTPAQASTTAAPSSASASAVNVATTVTLATKAKKTPLSQAGYENRLHRWANKARAHHGIRALSVRPCHENFAQRWARHLANKNEFYHQDLGRYMTSCKLGKAGEILAMGSVSPRNMVRMWMHSSTHRQILLDRSFRLAGIGARKDARGNWVGCIDFGRRL